MNGLLGCSTSPQTPHCIYALPNFPHKTLDLHVNTSYPPPMSFPSLPTPTREDAARALENARLKAAVNLEVLLDALTLRGLDPASNFKALLDSFEASYKVSGLAAKQAAASSAGSGFSINIVLGKQGEKVVPGVEVCCEPDALGDPPAYLVPSIASNLEELRCDIGEVS